jgi:hypothetical protein
MTHFKICLSSLALLLFFFSCGGGGSSDFPTPDVSFATYQEVSAYTDSLRTKRRAMYFKIHPNKGDQYKDEFKAKYVAAAAGQTCDCLSSFDLDYAKQDDYVLWAGTAQLNYNQGVETEADSKLIAFNQLLNVYGILADKGSIIKLENGNDYGSTAFSTLYSNTYKAEVEKQCADLREEFMAVHKAKYLDHGLLDYLRD